MLTSYLRIVQYALELNCFYFTIVRDDHAQFDVRDKNISIRKIAKNRENKNNDEKKIAMESRVLRYTTNFQYVILFCNAFAAGYLKRVAL